MKVRVMVDRIALLSLNLHGYGTERTLFNLARGFTDRGIPVDLLLVNAEGPLLAQVPAGIRVIALKRQRLLAKLPLVRNMVPLVRYLQAERPAVLLSAFEQTNIAALWAGHLARSSTRIVVSAHFPFTRHFSQSGRLRDRHLMRPLVHRFYRWADAIVAVSQGAAADLANVAGLPRERIRVIYNPVPADLTARAAQPLDHPWFAAGAPPVILAVGRLTPQKNFSMLIRAFALVRQHRQARLLILGDGWKRDALEALVCELGLEDDVALPGFVDNPYPYMSRAAVFALSSSWEALPVVLLEALTLGTPIVATDCDSGPHEILEGGRWGTLVLVENPTALADALIEVLNSPEKRVVSAEARARFRIDHVVDQYLELLYGDGGAQTRTTTDVQPLKER